MSMSVKEVNRIGVITWTMDGLLHREDGPAIIFPQSGIRWYQFGKRHREDGPAVEYPNGDKEWWLNGVEYEPMEWLLKRFELGLK